MSQFLDDFAEFIRYNQFNVYGIAEIKDGVIQSKSLKPCNPCQNSYSVTKVFVVTAIGILFDMGLISLGEKVTDILKRHLDGNIREEYKTLTVHQTIKHCIGLNGGFLDIDAVDSTTFGKDFLNYIFKTKPTHTVGADSVYTDGAYYILSRTVTEKAGIPMEELLWKKLLFPLGVKEAAFSKCPKGYAIGATGLYIRTEDMAKLGQVYLDGGKYKGQQIISKKWVDTVFEQGYELHSLNNGKAFGKGGMNGQMLMILPSQSRVVAWHSYEPKGTSPLKNFVLNYGEVEQ